MKYSLWEWVWLQYSHLLSVILSLSVLIQVLHIKLVEKEINPKKLAYFIKEH
jgi:hypothetical protein